MRPATDNLSAISEKSYWREPDARQVLTLLESSGQTVTAFAREHGISVHRIRYWRYRLRRDQPVGEVIPFYRVELKTQRSNGSSPSSSDEPTGVELALPGGCRVKLGRNFDGETLLRVVDLLGGTGC